MKEKTAEKPQTAAHKGKRSSGNSAGKSGIGAESGTGKKASTTRKASTAKKTSTAKKNAPAGRKKSSDEEVVIPQSVSRQRTRKKKARSSTGFVAWLALLISVAALVIALMPKQVTETEQAMLVVSRAMVEYPEQVRGSLFGDKEGKSVILLYWQLIVSNTGNRDMTLVSTTVTEMTGSSTRSDYPELYNRFYTNDLTTQLDLPHIIEAGHVVKFYLRSGFSADPEVYRLIREKYEPGRLIHARDLTTYLNANGVDLFGNDVMSVAAANSEDSTASAVARKKTGLEQVFSISFKTARGNTVQDFVSLAEWNTEQVKK